MMRRDASAASQGFTLLELLIVLAISVLGFAAISISLSSGQHGTQLQIAAQDIASALRYARGQALLSNSAVGVTIDLADNHYRIDHHPKIFALAPEIAVSLVVAEEELVAGQQASIRFFADGSSTGGRITLEWGKQLRRIDVNWITGRVTISDAAA
ncbi:MAG: GspH/FimT family pseudopilin [Methylomonas sp.]|nr:GspH/FimT family pseudopilin [Methylomonas sp.]MBS3964763.1 GspH/FimT family pseudopilin [Methylomonas sp.]PPD22639.1 MAG: type II secretion system protein GspH [Methylomonas sp.]PPD27951.1 MAG: type II secretion system protein GspH [Methylomonas sp.]PPD40060.1 MAG: type II secretion system protein GspH [Methylomonas sp.]